MSPESARERNLPEGLEKAKEVLSRVDFILSARVYGSSLYKESASRDIDVAVMIPSSSGVVKGSTFEKLREFRFSLSATLGQDIDLIPHTFDEIQDSNSPLWNPRYHPSLRFGIDIKSAFPFPKNVTGIQNAAAYVLLDNRTVTRRQILRDCNRENWSIFLSKLVHGPGNALTYLSLRDGKDYLANPSDVERAFAVFDSKFGTSSGPIISLFGEAGRLLIKDRFSFEHAVELMNWYESLVSSVLDYDSKQLSEYFRRRMA